MYTATAHAVVDAVQDAKVKMVEQLVQHEGTCDALKSFVEAQRKYTKSAVDSGIATLTSLSMIYASPQFYKEMGDQWLKMIKVK